MTECQQCPALCKDRVNIVPPTPAPANGILAVGEAPGQREAQMAEGFVGQSGKRLDQVMAGLGILRADYGRANICRCRPPGNRRPTTVEINNCIPLLADFIFATKPRVLLLVGGTAAGPFFGQGSLLSNIHSAEERCFRFDSSLAHPGFKKLDELNLRIVPIPHTSGLSWNRTAPTGERWSKIGIEQIQKVIDLLT